MSAPNSNRPSPTPPPNEHSNGDVYENGHRDRYQSPVRQAGRGEEEDELQEDDSPAPTGRSEAVPAKLHDRERENASAPLMTTAAIKMQAPAISASGSGSGSTHAPSPRTGSYSAGGGKSRKSSCELCHHRKIKCDQQRPSCSSCIRKGQPCRYADDAEPSNVQTPVARGSQHQRAMSVTIVNASDPSIKYTMPVPGTTTPSLKVGYGHGNHPEWKVADNVSEKGSAEKKKSAERRERIVSGFDSDSDEEAEGSFKGKSAPGSVAGSREKSKDVDGELAALVGGNKQDEVDELDDEPEKDGSEASQDQGKDIKKRGASMDDDLSGELLELASAPPKKKKKPIAPAFTSSQSFSRPAPKPIGNRPSGGRSSLPLGVIPPTPATSTAALSYTGRQADAGRFDPYSTPLQNLVNSLPSQEMQNILFNTFFTDPFLTEGISLLQPQYMDDFKGLLERRATRFQAGDATTLANAFAFLAVSLRILPEETSKLLLASQGYGNVTSHLPRSLSKIVACQPAAATDPTPLYQRYLDLALVAAQIAEQADPPSVMLVMLKLVLYRYCMLGHRRDKVVLAGMWLAQAVKVAQALGMGKEWEGLTQGERELRRRVMWSLYIADRHHSFETSFPYTIMDAHQGIHLPSPMAEVDLYKLRPDIRELPAHATELAPTACTALFIHTHLARRITPILDSFATISAANTPHDLVLRFDASLDAFQDALPPYFRLFPLTETRFDSTHPYLPAHRVRLHATLLAYRTGVHRTHLINYLRPDAPTGIRQVIAQVCLSSLRVQRSAKMLDSKVAFRLFNPITVFENAATLALIMHVEKALSTPPPPPTAYASSSEQGLSPTSLTVAPVMTPEYMSMRAGVAEAAELLDNVSAGEGQTFARSAVAVLREVMVKVDAPLKAALTINGHGASAPVRPPISPDRPTLSAEEIPSHPEVQALRDTERERSTISSASTSPISIDKLTSSTTPQAKPAVPVAPAAAKVENPFVENVVRWLEDLRKAGVNLDLLLREPEWAGGWDRIVAGM
ncbi:hypothetical protein I317_01142 [Kwoniella heveanensis CBS 569]|nr:hypothetical protein I317_01142 [Kwoniella heveanensis CBS 569]